MALLDLQRQDGTFDAPRSVPEDIWNLALDRANTALMKHETASAPPPERLPSLCTTLAMLILLRYAVCINGFSVGALILRQWVHCIQSAKQYICQELNIDQHTTGFPFGLRIPFLI